MEADGKSYLTASGGSAPVNNRDLASSPSTNSIDSFHTPEPLESDYQRAIVEDVPEYKDEISDRILRQANYQEETDHFVTDPDQPKLALADSVRPSREKQPISNSQLYNGEPAPGHHEVRQRRHVSEATPLLTDQQQKDRNIDSTTGCCNIL